MKAILAMKQIVENTDTTAGRVFGVTIQLLIILSLVSFAIETLPHLPDHVRQLLKTLEIIIVLFFTAEYLLRLFVADRKLGYAFSFFGIFDLLAILPFYVASGIDLRSIRIVRLLRLFRAFKLVRYSVAIQRFHRAFKIAKEEIVLFLFASILLLYVSSVGIYYFENQAQPDKFASIFHSLWWSVATLTTVGYGDVFPVTVGGRLFTFFVLLIGLGIVAVPAGLVVSALSEARKLEDAGRANDSETSNL